MSSKPLVSILIPAYNAQELIGETIQSALAQTWPRKEIIVVDDGSTDETFAVARRFESVNVKVVTKPNAGAAAARNKALSLSQGDYVQWLDADDLLSPNKIECQMLAAEQAASRRVLLSSGWVYFHYRTKHTSIVPTALWHDLSPTEWLVRKMTHNLHMQTSTWLVSRELTLDAGAVGHSTLLGRRRRVLLSRDSRQRQYQVRSDCNDLLSDGGIFVPQQRREFEAQTRITLALDTSPHPVPVISGGLAAHAFRMPRLPQQLARAVPSGSLRHACATGAIGGGTGRRAQGTKVVVEVRLVAATVGMGGGAAGAVAASAHPVGGRHPMGQVASSPRKRSRSLAARLIQRWRPRLGIRSGSAAVMCRHRFKPSECMMRPSIAYRASTI